jgi:hypothetical protein
LSDAGAVSGIVIKDGHVGFTIEIDPKEKDKADEFAACLKRLFWRLTACYRQRQC